MGFKFLSILPSVIPNFMFHYSLWDSDIKLAQTQAYVIS